MKDILIVVGTRPNFVKITQFKKEALKYPNLRIKIIHTGQHSDEQMSKVFFTQFDLEIDHHLNIESTDPGSQIGEMISKITLFLDEHNPDLVMVVGDVNSTLAAAIATNKAGISLAHLESGLRSGDRTMPEELNRILTDELSDYCFATEPYGYDNLLSMGKSKESIFLVGNTMIDTIKCFESEIDSNPALENVGLAAQKYLLLTLHRAANVDFQDGLYKLVELLSYLSKEYSIVFPIHPRTKKMLQKYDLWSSINNLKGIYILPPLDYFAFQKLVKNAQYMITDSGGIQNETFYYKTPCITLRSSTEHKLSTEIGGNTLLEFDANKIAEIIRKGNKKVGIPYGLNDGKTTERILNILNEILSDDVSQSINKIELKHFE